MTLKEQQFALSEYYLNLKKKEFNLDFYKHSTGTKGYRGIDLSRHWILKGNKEHNFWGTNWPTKEECWRGNILEISKKFDFLNDLNAVHLLENLLENEEIKRIYVENLVSLLKDGEFTVMAEADKRAEALLKTLNLWKSHFSRKRSL